MKKTIICLMGPTGAGKTPLAVELVKRLPCDIISVDSAMVYRDMDIGTAKPPSDILAIAPHRLINLLDPVDHYSAGQFRVDALREIEDILAHNKIPLLVGGTMMYFRALQAGIAALPLRDANTREALQKRAHEEGWETLHKVLSVIDPEAGRRIHVNDTQRIQRALEVFMLTGKTMTASQSETNPLADYHLVNIAIAPMERVSLHARIALRFEQMLEQGLVEEVRHLYERGDLNADLPSIRSVGYRQIWAYLAGNGSYEEMKDKTLSATRQLAKRQLTWLRSWPDVRWLNSDAENLCEQIIPVLMEAVDR